MFLQSSFVNRGKSSEYYYSLNPENPKEGQATVGDATRVDNSNAKQKISSSPNISKDIEKRLRSFDNLIP